MNDYIDILLSDVNKKRVWDQEPIFCFTADMDWASEAVLDIFFKKIIPLNIKPTIFVTNASKVIDKYFKIGNIDRGIHPNFLNNSSHGDNFIDVIDTCISFAPESICFRSHRLFDVTDITHLLKEKFGFKYVSNLGTIMQTKITPILCESGLLHYPIFFEDGTHLYNQLNLDMFKYMQYFTSPGIKIINFHPMNFVFNSPNMRFMRSIKDSISRKAYNNIDKLTIERLRNTNEVGIGNTIMDIIDFAKSENYSIMSLSEIYGKTIE